MFHCFFSMIPTYLNVNFLIFPYCVLYLFVNTVSKDRIVPGTAYIKLIVCD